jgi:hypothetical protein
MNKFAQVTHGKVVAIFEKAAGYDQYFDQKSVIMIDVTDLKITPEKGWNYDASTGTFSPPTDDQLWVPIREKRNALLNASDKMMLADNFTKMPGKLQEQWKTYRQQLRDMPSKFGPEDVIWPTPPSR